jgi:hypothetical protein
MRAADYATGSPCPNCAAPLTGPYCAQCGQHAHHSARGFGALLHDGWETLTHLDGRAWRTLAALLFRPGRLTIEYFRDRRARYVPPVRLYLIMSLLFFGAVGIASHDGPGQPKVQATAAKPGQTLEQACDDINSAIPELAALLRRSCHAQLASGGRDLAQSMQHNVPRMMFIFLPLLAAFMRLLYWRPRRLYVEHLVFFLHNHAALFAVFLLGWALEWLGGKVSWLAALAGPLVLAGMVYTLWYIYRSMRRVYAQSRAVTLGKMLLLSVAYATCLLSLLVATLVFSALVT